MKAFTNLVVGPASVCFTPTGASAVYLGYSFDEAVCSFSEEMAELESPNQAIGLSEAIVLSRRASITINLTEMSLDILRLLLGKDLSISTDGTVSTLKFGYGLGWKAQKGKVEFYCMAPDGKKRKITLYNAYITGDAKDYNATRDAYTTISITFNALIDVTEEHLGEIVDDTSEDWDITTGLESS